MVLLRGRMKQLQSLALFLLAATVTAFTGGSFPRTANRVPTAQISRGFAIYRNYFMNNVANISHDATSYKRIASSLSSNTRNNDLDEPSIVSGNYNNNNNNNNNINDDLCDTPEDQEELSETQQLMARVKDAGTAGVVSYAFWELAFWCLSVPVCVVGYKSVTGHWPDWSNPEDQKQLGAEAFAFVNVARFAVPLRIGLALSTTGWVQENVLDRFNSKKAVQDDCMMVGDSFGDDDYGYGYDDYSYGNNSVDDIAYSPNMRQMNGEYQKQLITRK